MSSPGRICKRLLLMVLLTMAAFVAIYVLTPREELLFTMLAPGEGGQVNTVLFSLNDDMQVQPLLETPNPAAYGDGLACYVEFRNEDHTNWAVITADLETGQKKTIGEGAAPDETVFGNQLILADGHVYLSVCRTENSRIVDIRIQEFNLDGSEGRIFQNVKYDLCSVLHGADGKLFYVDPETGRPIALDLDTGTEQFLWDQRAFFSFEFTYLDSGCFWYVTADGDTGTGEAMAALTGVPLEDGIVATIPLAGYLEDSNYWIHDGFLYRFRDRRRIEDEMLTYGDLWQTDLDTLQERCLCEALPYDNNFPPELFFGEKGIVATDSLFTGQNWKETANYIPYDGIGAMPLTLP